MFIRPNTWYLNFAIDNKIDFLVVGPEKPLVDGIVDFFQKQNIKIFGPEKIASQLEGSKIFTKKICEKYKIPTAKFGVFEKLKQAELFLKTSKFPLVVKADGLAAGKGVYICENIKSAKIALEEIFNGKFGKAENILIEEFLVGEEMSYFVVSDGATFKKFQTAQDHKRVLENDKGKNTGGTYGKKIKFKYFSVIVKHKTVGKIKIVFIKTKEQLIPIVSTDLELNDEEIINLTFAPKFKDKF